MTSIPAAELPRRPAAPLPPTDILLVEDNPLEVELTLRPLRELDPPAGSRWRETVRRPWISCWTRGEFRHRHGAPLAPSGPAGPETAQARRPRGSPGESGETPAPALTPVVVLTSSTDPRQLAQCYQLGANSCVQKPVRYEEFWATIQTRGPLLAGFNQLRRLSSPLGELIRRSLQLLAHR